jgi:hypothetical protein
VEKISRLFCNFSNTQPREPPLAGKQRMLIQHIYISPYPAKHITFSGKKDICSPSHFNPQRAKTILFLLKFLFRVSFQFTELILFYHNVNLQHVKISDNITEVLTPGAAQQVF